MGRFETFPGQIAYHHAVLKPGQHPQSLIPEVDALYDHDQSNAAARHAGAIGGRVKLIPEGTPYTHGGRDYRHGRNDGTHNSGAGPLPPNKR